MVSFSLSLCNQAKTDLTTVTISVAERIVSIVNCFYVIDCASDEETIILECGDMDWGDEEGLEDQIRRDDLRSETMEGQRTDNWLLYLYLK